MKFLVAQFAVYLALALSCGVAAGIALNRLGHRRSALQVEHLQRSLAQATERVAALESARSRDAALLADARGLTSKLAELHGAMTVVEADVRANQMTRAEAERARDVALAGLDSYRLDAQRARQADHDVARLRAQLSAVRASLAEQRSADSGETAEARARAEAAEAALAALRERHDRSVVELQLARTRAEVAAEEARADLLLARAELLRVDRVDEVGPSVVIDLRESADIAAQPAATALP